MPVKRCSCTPLTPTRAAPTGRRARSSEWSAMLLSDPAAPLDDAFPWSVGSALWHGPAPAANFPRPK